MVIIAISEKSQNAFDNKKLLQPFIMSNWHTRSLNCIGVLFGGCNNGLYQRESWFSGNKWIWFFGRILDETLALYKFEFT